MTEATIDNAVHIVGMMGAEPLVRALDLGADVVLAGRSSDSALFAAYPLWKGAAAAPAWHMSKTIECGALCAERPPGARTGIWAELEDGAFVVGTTSTEARCTPVSVSAHTLYENPSPYELVEPSGTIDTRDSRYDQMDEFAVRVSGSRFIHAPQYTVKLEGAERVGYRTVTMAGVDDPILIAQLDDYLDAAAARTLAGAERQGFDRDSIRISFRRYGSGEPLQSRHPGMAVAVLADVIAPTQQVANAAANILHGLLLHSTYEGRLGTGGNMGYPFSPCDIPAGPVYRFSIWHTMALNDPLAPFPITLAEVGRG
ncbi:MAG: acyclic terpene utilization AtuA family protein [Dehalococcoidia bacterium]